MSTLFIARMVVIAVSLLPSCVAYFLGKNSIYFSKTKRLKLGAFFVGYSSILGTLLLEYYIYENLLNISRPDLFLNLIIPIQYGVAIVIFFVQITKKGNSDQSNN